MFKKPAILNYEHIMWTKVYNLSGEITIDTYSRMFNFKLNHNILFLNKSLSRMGLISDSACSFCNLDEETTVYYFLNVANQFRYGQTCNIFSKIPYIYPILHHRVPFSVFF